MAKVKNLKIQQVEGGNGTLYASWGFDVPKTTTSTNIKEGDKVYVSKDATHWVTGQTIWDGVYSLYYYAVQVDGNEVVISPTKNGALGVTGRIDVKYLTKADGETETVSEDTLDHFEVKWSYDSGGVWFSGSTTNVDKDDEWTPTYNPPDNAIRVRVSVKPVAKNQKVNNSDAPYFTGEAVTAMYDNAADPINPPGDPTVTIEKYTLTASILNIDDPRITKVEFQVLLNGESVYKTGTCTVRNARAIYSCDVGAGGKYEVRARGISSYGSKNIYSEWTKWSASQTTIPLPPSAITKCEAADETSVYLEWTESATAETYTVQYATNKNDFDITDLPQKKDGIEGNCFKLTGLESGAEYFFRVRAHDSKGDWSEWTKELVSVKIGTLPVAPTTWSSTTTAIAGENLVLYWVHNTEDNSRQTYAELELTVDGDTWTEYPIRKNEETGEIIDQTGQVIDEDVTTSSFEINTASYSSGATIEWRVRTAGVTEKLGEWSIKRKVNIYAPPELSLSVSGGSYPITISATPGPPSQSPTGYHVAIIADEDYESLDYIGRTKRIGKGMTVFSKYYDSVGALSASLTPSDVDLGSGVSYTVKCTVSMDTGLTAEDTTTMYFSASETAPEPDGTVTVDTDNYTASICALGSGGQTLAVYRREYDGSFTEIGSNLRSGTYVTDPHPSLDFARYRIVATSSSGGVGYYDMPAYPVNGKAVIIQWDEEWTSFDTYGEDAFDHPVWNGSMVKLPYNIDVNESNDIDVSFVKYVGRAHPVSYYGTQLGDSASWNVEVPKSDKETIYALRRLAKWTGDVYVREPSGVGYWANIKVSFSQKHTELAVPVSLSITRVEGGM